MKNWSKLHIGVLAGLGSGSSFAVAALAVKGAYAFGVTPWAYTAAGSLLALLLLAPWWRTLRSPGAVPAGLAGAGSLICYNIALARLELSVAVVVSYTFPAFALLMAWWVRGRTPTWLQSAAVVLCLGGVVLVTGNPTGWAGRLDPVGLLAGLGAALFHSAYGLLGERLSDREGLGAQVAASLCSLLLVLVIQPQDVAGGFGQPLPVWGFYAVSAVLGRVLPMWLYSTGSRLAGTTPASVAATVDLPLSLLLGLLVLGEHLAPVQWAGVITVVAGIGLAAVPESRRKASLQQGL